MTTPAGEQHLNQLDARLSHIENILNALPGKNSKAVNPRNAVPFYALQMARSHAQEAIAAGENNSAIAIAWALIDIAEKK